MCNKWVGDALYIDLALAKRSGDVRVMDSETTKPLDHQGEVIKYLSCFHDL